MTDERLKEIIEYMREGYCPDAVDADAYCENRLDRSIAQVSDTCQGCWAKAIATEMEGPR